MAINVTVWHEYRHEHTNEAVAKLYPKGMHQAIADALRPHADLNVRTATLDEPEHGLTDEMLDSTDVLFWWGHCAHKEVRDDIVDKVQQKVLAGMGLIVLHSGHYSKIFKRMMGTNCSLKWREAGEKERLWNLAQGHPLTEGIGEYIELPNTEMYGEHFDIPTPQELIFVSWFQGGEVFRSGCTWTRGHGRVFYFRPGHETYPIYHNEQIQQVLVNAARWGAKRVDIPTNKAPCIKEPLEPIPDTSKKFGTAGIEGQH